MAEKKELYRKIPKTDTLLMDDEIKKLCCVYGKDMVLAEIRQELDHLRACARQDKELDFYEHLSSIQERIRVRIEEMQICSLKRVINATGIILHTNLGRAPLGKKQIKAMEDAARGYSNLEYDLDIGKRGKRSSHYAEDIKKITGAEDAVAVNNNAAAVTLMLSSLAKGKEVIISRGEMIEIGGRFRIPDVMEQSGATLKEVGCTNRTRISDYEKAIGENTAALLKVHTSNYKIVGFTEEVSVDELVELGKKYQIPVLVDLGSGVLVNLEEFGLSHEPTVQEMIKKEVDVVCFSGDKLLGGPQAGILAGKSSYIKAMADHPLMRAIRLDKCTTAALAATFKAYLNKENALGQIPVLQMISRDLQKLKCQAEQIVSDLQKEKFCEKMSVEESLAMVGGGALPGQVFPSYAITIKPSKESCNHLCAKLRNLPIPVIGYIKDEKVFIDMRTILEDEVEELKENLHFLLADACENRTHPGRC